VDKSLTGIPHSHLFQDSTPEEEEEFRRLEQISKSIPTKVAGYIHDGQLLIELYAPLTDDAREHAIHFLKNCP
jgi:hypothetical protein